MPEKQVPWVIASLFAIVLMGGFAFAGYVQDRIQMGYLMLNNLTERVARAEEREKLDETLRISIDNRVQNLERGRSIPK